MECSPCKTDAVSQLLAASVSGGASKSPFNYYQYDSGAVAMTSGGSASVTIQTLPDSIFVCCYLMAIAYSTSVLAKQFTTQMYNGATGRQFNDAPVHSDLLWGSYASGLTVRSTSAQPNRLIDPLILPPSSNLVLSLVDLTAGGAYTLFLALGGYRWFDLQNPPKLMKQNAALQWFTYSATQTLAGNAGPQPVLTRVDADADFIVRKVNAFSTGLFQAQISDGSSQEPWTQNFEPAQVFAGNAMWPNILAKPRIIKRNSTLFTQLSDLSGSTNTIRVVYEGCKVYR